MAAKTFTSIQGALRAALLIAARATASDPNGQQFVGYVGGVRLH